MVNDKPQKGGTSTKSLTAHGSKLQCAVIRNGYLWTCNQIGVNNQNATTGLADYVSANPNRLPLHSAVQWLKVALPLTTSSTVTVGRVADNSGNLNPYWYYYPSLDINSSGDLLVGFSGSSSSEYIGAYFYGEKGGNAGTTGRPVLLHGGRAYSASFQWGHYSSTFTDDSGYFWTFQEFPVSGGNNLIYTILSRLRRNP